METTLNFNAETLYNFLTIDVRGKQFAIDVSQIKEIIEVPDIVNVPRSPAYMSGLINVRGNVLPVIDVGVKFNMPVISITLDSCIVILNLEIEGEKVLIGALADKVTGVLELKGTELSPSPSIGKQYNPEYVKGVFDHNELLTMIIDLGKVFSVEEKDYLNAQVEEEDTEEKSE